MRKADPVDFYLRQIQDTVQNMSRDQIWTVVQVLMNAWRRGQRVFILGNGGSASTASHLANDWNGLAIADGKPRFRVLGLPDHVAARADWIDDGADQADFADLLCECMAAGDVVIGICATGDCPNVLEALRVAHDRGGVTVSFSGSDAGRCLDLADHSVVVPSRHSGRQEDAHLILGHVIAGALTELISSELPDGGGSQNDGKRRNE